MLIANLYIYIYIVWEWERKKDYLREEERLWFVKVFSEHPPPHINWIYYKIIRWCNLLVCNVMQCTLYSGIILNLCAELN